MLIRRGMDHETVGGSHYRCMCFDPNNGHDTVNEKEGASQDETRRMLPFI